MNGVNQWLFQRAANALFVVFSLALFAVLLCSKATADFEAISSFLNAPAVQIALTLLLVVAGLNSLIAGWQIAGDYAKKFKIPTAVFIAITAVVSAVTLIIGLDVLFLK